MNFSDRAYITQMFTSFLSFRSVASLLTRLLSWAMAHHSGLLAVLPMNWPLCCCSSHWLVSLPSVIEVLSPYFSKHMILKVVYEQTLQSLEGDTKR